MGVWSEPLDAGVPGGMTWAERIPAVIEKADEHIANGEKYINRCEIALAQALWDYTQLLMHGPEKQAMLERDPTVFTPPALRAFVTKVEAL